MQVKEELYHVPTDETLARAELAGFLKFKGNVEIGKDIYLLITLKEPSSVRRIKFLLTKVGENESSVIYKKVRRLNTGNLFEVKVFAGDIKEFISRMGLDLTGKMHDEFFKDPAVLGAFLRGAFISSGYIANPAKYHHLEIYSKDIEILKWLKAKLENTVGMVGFIVDVRYGYRFYIKNGETINEFLNFIGSVESARLFSSIMSSKKISSDITRSMNFIDANSKRSGNASWKQINAIKFVSERIGLENFPEDVQKIAKLRIEHPELSLSEIGKMIDPPLSKSVVYRRLFKIIQIAEKQQ
ncbi:putative sporulation transcription regulator WhiA [Athalassotoga saccharophila]|nr:putative sporulation transcription regulator WhiA [Athalassotoga saccharophila]